jgi:hypothetical protein
MCFTVPCHAFAALVRKTAACLLNAESAEEQRNAETVPLSQHGC